MSVKYEYIIERFEKQQWKTKKIATTADILDNITLDVVFKPIYLYTNADIVLVHKYAIVSSTKL